MLKLRWVINYMIDLKEIFFDCVDCSDEYEWFEFKSNHVSPDDVGTYISALSNSAAMLGREESYVFFGVDDKTHEIKGTTFNQNESVNGNEPLQHYLARQLSPSVAFYFEEMMVDSKRIVALVIPAAKTVPTGFKDVRYIRIGSSREKLSKYPQREAKLFSVLTFGMPTVLTVESKRQHLTFNQLFGYYGMKGLKLRENTFEENLDLRNKDGKYNLLAQLLSDNSQMPVRVAIFAGKTKASKLYAVREFGYQCLLYSLDEVLRYGDVLNIFQADETNRIVERKEVRLFNMDAFREAVINAFLHNKWVDGNEPMITVYSDRIEILSRGGLAPLQTKAGFFRGHSVPVNEKLSEIFLQLHISEKTGRGIPVISSEYGEGAFDFSDNDVTATIPFNFINEAGDKVGDKVGDKAGDKTLNDSQTRVLAEIRNNPNITKPQLMIACNLGKTSIDNIISTLKKKGYIERVGSNKSGYWKTN